MELSVNNWIIGITAVVSLLAFNNAQLLDRLILWPPAIARQKQYERLLTHGFIHADWMHLLFNMMTLYFFGRPMEAFFAAHIGETGYAVFYLSAIVVAILPTYMSHQNDSRYRSLGASGAVSAVLFSFILWQPWTPIYMFFIPIGIPAFIFAILYIAYSIWMDRRGRDNVNHSAHLWGAAYGVMFALFMEPGLIRSFLLQIMHPSLVQ